MAPKHEMCLKKQGDCASTGCKHSKSCKFITKLMEKARIQNNLKHERTSSITVPTPRISFTALELIYVATNSRANLQSHSSFVI